MKTEKYLLVLAFIALFSYAGYSYVDRSQPDLTVTDITFTQLSGCITNTSKVSVIVTMYVDNWGNATALNFTDRLNIGGTSYYYPVSSLNPWGTYYYPVSSLNPWGTVAHSKTITRRCGVQFYANATADFYNNVAESNELNNVRYELYTPV
jgi:hypothetical protein